MEKYQMILKAEEQFAREVTLGVIVTRPLTVWHYIIPGMFIIDFLRRGTAIRQYSKHFLFPRKLAMDAARALAQDEDEAEVFSRIETDTSAWLTSVRLYTPELLRAQLAVIELLIDHYGKLLAVNGNSVNALIKEAYKTRQNYQQFIDELTAAEAGVDSEIIAKAGPGGKLSEKISAEQNQLQERRQKIIEEVF